MICFHHNDLDGRCSAAIVWKWYNEKNYDMKEPINFIELDYKDDVPVLKIAPGEKVIIVDFSFKPEVMHEVFKRTSDIIWCDHHKTAAHYDYGRKLKGYREFEEKKLAGCECTWLHFFPHKPIPHAVFLIADRDCWRWSGGKETAEFNQGLKIHDTRPTSGIWNAVFYESDYHAFSERVCEQGRTCLSFRDSFCNDYADSYGFETEFEGHKAFAMGIYMFGSEAFGQRFYHYPLCLSFVYDGKQWVVGLYSQKIDVGEIARQYGGGGHTGAAGFVCDKLPFNAMESNG
jgi:oligoribonuclease NrnB/cAMP/cGMP phosphodiesterase (DHH superfamily)